MKKYTSQSGIPSENDSIVGNAYHQSDANHHKVKQTKSDAKNSSSLEQTFSKHNESSISEPKKTKRISQGQESVDHADQPSKVEKPDESLSHPKSHKKKKKKKRKHLEQDSVEDPVSKFEKSVELLENNKNLEQVEQPEESESQPEDHKKKKKKRKHSEQESVKQGVPGLDVEKPDESEAHPENHKKKKRKRKHSEQESVKQGVPWLDFESVSYPENHKTKKKHVVQEQVFDDAGPLSEVEKPGGSWPNTESCERGKKKRKHSEHESVEQTDLGSEVEKSVQSLHHPESRKKKKKKKKRKDLEQESVFDHAGPLSDDKERDELLPNTESHKKKKKNLKHLEQELVEQPNLESEVEKPDESLANQEILKKKKRKRKHLEHEEGELPNFVLKTENESLLHLENNPNHESVEYSETLKGDTSLAQPTNLIDGDRSDSSNSDIPQEKMKKKKPLYPLINSILMETPLREPSESNIQKSRSQSNKPTTTRSVKKEPVSMSESFDKIKDNETEEVLDSNKVKIECRNPSDLKEAMAKVVAEEMKRKDLPHQSFRKGKIEKIYSNGDFIQNALQGALPFNTEGWETKPELSMKNQFPELYFNDCEDEILRRFMKFCQRDDKRPLPRLNAENRLLAVPYGGKLQYLKTHFPSFKSGRFSPSEDAIIQKNFGSLAASLQFGPNEAQGLISGCMSITKRSKLSVVRLYLGAMIGWEMLEDRLAIDIYHRLVNLVKLSRQDQFLSDKKTIEKIVDLYEVGKLSPKLNQIVKDLDGELDVRSKKLRHILDKALNEKSGEKVSSGRFTLEESCSLLELVMNQQKTKNFDRIDIKKINFKAIGAAMHRTKSSVSQHFNGVIIPAMGSRDADEDDPTSLSLNYRIKMFKLILEDESIQGRQDIKWGQFSKALGQPNEKLRNILGANVIYPPPADTPSPSPSSFRQAVEIALKKAERIYDDFQMGGTSMKSTSRGISALRISVREMKRFRDILEFYDTNFHY